MIWWYLARRDRGQATLLVSSSQPFRRAGASWKNSLRHLPFILRLLAISCLIIALARPLLPSV